MPEPRATGETERRSQAWSAPTGEKLYYFSKMPIRLTQVPPTGSITSGTAPHYPWCPPESTG